MKKQKCNNMEVELQAGKAELKEAKEVQKQITKSHLNGSVKIYPLYQDSNNGHVKNNYILILIKHYSLDQERVSASSITLKHDETSESEVLDLGTGTYSKPETTSTNDINEAILYVKDRFGLSDSAYLN